jgi:hypothetical protein
MNKRSTEAYDPKSLARITATAAYSAHIQEAMRFDKLRPSDYSLVMSIMHAVSQGFTEHQWETEQKSAVKALHNRPPDKESAHADTADRYEQTIALFKNLTLWPW